MIANKATWLDYRSAASLLLFFWLGALILSGMPGYPIDYDSSIHAVIAKNIATGQGWNTIYRNEYADNTSGDLILLPAAIMTWLCGNRPWVPGLSAALLNLSAFGAVLLYSRRLFPTRTCLSWQTGLVLWFIFFEFSWWHVLTGEMSAYFLFLLACLVAVDESLQTEKQRAFMLGILLGLSFNCKVVVTFPGFAAIAIVLLWKWRSQIVERSNLVFPALFGILSVFAVLTVIESSIYTLEPSSHTFAESKWWRINILPEVLHNHAANYRKMISSGLNPVSVGVYTEVMSRYGFRHGFSFALLACPPAVGLMTFFNRKHSPFPGLDRLQAILVIAYLFYFLQYFKVYDSPYDHHAFYTIHTLLIVLLLFLLRHLESTGVLLFVALMLLPSLADNRSAFGELTQRLAFHPEENAIAITDRQYMDDVRDVVSFLEHGNFAYPLANCGWLNATREIDYLLPASMHFLNCFDEISSHYVRDPQDAHYRWNQPVAFTLVINKFYWKAAKTHKPTLQRQNYLIHACGNHILYESRYYKVLSCSFGDLKETLPDDDSNPFKPRPPEWADHLP